MKKFIAIPYSLQVRKKTIEDMIANTPVEDTERHAVLASDLSQVNAELSNYGEKDMTPEEIAEREAEETYNESLPPVSGFPTQLVLEDVETGEPVKVVIKNGETFVGGDIVDAPIE